MQAFEGFKIRKFIGSGSYADVQLARNIKTGRDVALKMAKINPTSQIVLEKEAEILGQLDHPHVIRTFGLVANQNTSAMVMELADMSLNDYLLQNGPMSESAVLLVAKQALLGLQYLAQKGVMARDLKPENILLFKCDTADKDFPYVVKLADFGVAKQFPETIFDTETNVGTELYMAPEFVIQELKGGTDTRADVFSLGVTLFQCLVGELPYARNKEGFRKFYEQNKDQWVALDFKGRGSQPFQELVKSMIAIQIGQRVYADLALNRRILSQIHAPEVLKYKYPDLKHLTEYGGVLKPRQIAKVLASLCGKLQALEPGLYDLRPQNILVDPESLEALLADDEKVDYTSLSGQLDFYSMQPIQVIDREQYDLELAASYSLSCLGFYLLSGQLPFLDYNTRNIEKRIEARNFTAALAETKLNKKIQHVLKQQLEGTPTTLAMLSEQLGPIQNESEELVLLRDQNELLIESLQQLRQDFQEQKQSSQKLQEQITALEENRSLADTCAQQQEEKIQGLQSCIQALQTQAKAQEKDSKISQIKLEERIKSVEEQNKSLKQQIILQAETFQKQLKQAFQKRDQFETALIAASKVQCNCASKNLFQAAEAGCLKCCWRFRSQIGQATEGGMTATMIAAKAGKHEVVKLLMQKEAGRLDAQGRCAAHHAAFEVFTTGGKKIALQALLDSLEEVEAARMSDLMIAVLLSDEKSVQQHLDQAGQKDINGMTALMYACCRGTHACFDLLVDKEAGIYDDDGLSALYWAAHFDRDQMVKKLAASEAKKFNKNGRTQLMEAAIRGDKRSVKLLIPCEAKTFDKEGKTALVYAIQYKYQECVELLLQVEKCAQDQNRMTALMHAAARGDIKVVQFLMLYEGDMFDKDNKTALIYAYENKTMECFDILLPLERGLHQSNLKTRLMIAAERKDIKTCKLLSFDEFELRDASGKKAIDYAYETKNMEVVKAVIPPFEKLLEAAKQTDCSCCGKSTGLLEAGERGCLSCCAKFINQVGLKNSVGENALYQAAYYGNYEVVKLLLHKEVKNQDHYGWTALIGATIRAHLEIVKLLAPFEMGMRKNDGKTALQVAEHNNLKACVAFLSEFPEEK